MTAEAGLTVTPAGRPVGVTVIEAGGVPQATGTTDAVTVAAAPPASRTTVAGATTGVKPFETTFTMKFATAVMPHASRTRMLTSRDPSAAPVRAETANATVWAGGISGMSNDRGVITRSVGRPGKVTVGDPM